MGPPCPPQSWWWLSLTGGFEKTLLLILFYIVRIFCHEHVSHLETWEQRTKKKEIKGDSCHGNFKRQMGDEHISRNWGGKRRQKRGGKYTEWLKKLTETPSIKYSINGTSIHTYIHKGTREKLLFFFLFLLLMLLFLLGPTPPPSTCLTEQIMSQPTCRGHAVSDISGVFQPNR